MFKERVFHEEIDPDEAAVLVWSTSNGMMKLVDRDVEYWKTRRNLDLETRLRRSHGFLVEARPIKEALARPARKLPYYKR